MVGRHLDEHQRQAVGIADDHLEEPPGPDGGLLLDRDAQRREALARGAQVAHLEEQAGRAGRRRPASLCGSAVRRRVGLCLRGAGEGGVDLAGDVAFEASHDVALGEPFRQAPFDVSLGARFVAHAAVTIMCRALLAWRLPPRLSRCRLVLPDDAGSGAAPHSIANAASEVRRSGFSPAVTMNWAAQSVPTPLISSRAGASSATSGSIDASRAATSSLRSRMRLASDRRAILVAMAGSR